MKISPWLYRIASNTVTDKHRRDKVILWLSLEGLLETAPNIDLAGQDLNSYREEVEWINTILGRMDDLTRQIMNLLGEGGIEYKEVAARISDMGTYCTEAMVKMRVKRFREKAKAMILATKTRSDP